MTEKAEKGEMPEVETQVVETPEVVEEENFDEARAKELIAKLRATEKQAKKDAAKLAKLEEAEQIRADAEKSELQKAQELVAGLTLQKKLLELRILKRDIAAKTKLPDVFVDRLRGETPEELEADALEILAAMPAKVPPKVDPTNPGGIQPGETEADRKRRLGI